MKDRFSKSSETRRAEMPNPQHDFVSLRGYEADRIFNLGSYPNRTWTKIGDSDFVSKNTTTDAHAVYYRMQNAGRVFAAGTIQWAWGLDDFGGNAAIGPALRPNISNPDVEIVTENILRCLKDGGTYCGEN